MDDISKFPPITSDVAAKLAADRGWSVFPCLGDKRPATPHGFQDASADPDTVARLWRDFPGPLIGVATGAVSGFDVLDLDHVKHSSASKFLADHASWLDDVPRCTTRSGGLHLYFAHLAGLKCSVGRPVPGVDVRADGGYVIWWPAVLEHGPGSYEHPGLTLPDWPAALLALLRPPERPFLAPVQRERFPGDIGALLRLIERAPVGQRNSVVFWCACRAGEKIREGTLTRGEAERWLLACAVHIGLSQREALATIRSGLERTL